MIFLLKTFPKMSLSDFGPSGTKQMKVVSQEGSGLSIASSPRKMATSSEMITKFGGQERCI